MNLKVKRYSILTVLIILSWVAVNGCSTNNKPTELSSSVLTVKYDSLMHSIVTPNIEGANSLMKDYSASEKLVLGGEALENFKLTDSEYIETDSSKKLILTGLYDSNNLKIEKSVRLQISNKYPDVVIKNVTYKNLSDSSVEIVGWVNEDYNIKTVARNFTEILVLPKRFLFRQQETGLLL
ncbi:MAG: hypothetical protein U5K00_16345 [Melioribacteraceae bacterium]|nr:hypothetical protein [Melioribacteraceae bacterium]